MLDFIASALTVLAGVLGMAGLIASFSLSLPGGSDA